MKCPSWENLTVYVRGQASAEERAPVAAHLATGCRRCTENHRWLAETLRLAAADHSVEFPDEVIVAVVNRFKEQATTVAATKLPKLKLIAQLIFDSLLPRPLAAVRSELAGDDSSGRQMLYHANGYDIDLRFERGTGREENELIGQVMAEQPNDANVSALEVNLLRDETVIASAQTDGHGIFRFTRVPAGHYDLHIQLPANEIIVNQVSPTRAE